MPSRFTFLRVVAMLLAQPALAGSVLAQPVPSPVPTAVLRDSTQGTSFTLTGALQALTQSSVAAQTAGNVLQLAVKAGDRVRAGQVLARIDERSAAAGLAAADAGVAQAQALLANARAQAERTRELKRQGFVSQAALDAAETQLQAAQAGQDQARAGRVQADLARRFATVTAPFDAVVLATHVEAGDLAAPGRPLVTLYAPGQLRATAQVPSTRSALARAATAVQIQLPDGRWVAPVSRTELPSADPVAQTVEWRLNLAPQDAAVFAPGQAVQVRFTGATATATGAVQRPVLPLAAVLQRGELSAVYAVQDGRFVLRPVRLRAPQGEAGVEVLAGLKTGERYATDAVKAGLAGAVPAPEAARP